MFHDLTKAQKRALRAAAELARRRDRTMASEDADVHYLDARAADLPIVVGGAVANGIITIDDVGEDAREVVADLAAKLAAVIDEGNRNHPEPDPEDEYDPSAAVSVEAIVDQIDMLSDQTVLCVNRRTGEVVVIDGDFVPEDDELDAEESNEESDEDDPEWLAAEKALGRDISTNPDWLILLDRNKVDEIAIMKRFARDARPAASRDLFDALSRRGAFRQFRSVIRDRGLQEEWDRYRNQRLSDPVKWLLQQKDVAFRK